MFCGVNNEAIFRNDIGVSVANFLELLTFYLKPAFIGWQSEKYVQNSGVCIGLKVAPVLSDIFLARIDRNIHKGLFCLAKKVSQFVDDFLVISEKELQGCKVVNVLKLFREQGMGLKLTHEVARNNQFKFLDLTVHLKSGPICYLYSSQTVKCLVKFSSGHSKIVKSGIALSCLRSAFWKSCIHTMNSAF